MRYRKNIKFLFLLSSSCVFLFGLLVQLLQSRLGSCLDGWPVIFSPAVCSQYTECILLGFTVTGAVYLISREKHLTSIFSIFLSVCILFLAILLIYATLPGQTDSTTINSGQVISRSEEISALRNHSVFLGRGDGYFKTSFKSPFEKESQENRLYFAFCTWHHESQLPVLSYCYGWWIIICAIFTALFWSICTVWGYYQVTNRFTYLSCTLFLAIQLWGPIADYFGFWVWTLDPVLFSAPDSFCWTLFWVIPLLGTFLSLSAGSERSI